jgi:ATP adenylyltransferase
MDRLWSPWRYQYVSQAPEKSACIFCEHAAAAQDEQNYVLHRAGFNFVVLNLYPYTNGHLMIAPYQHVPDLVETPAETLAEMMKLAQAAEAALRAEYQPEGINVGFNLGRCAGAGVAGHLHLHMLPRWFGDTSFMTAIGETRVLPEDLRTTYQKLRKHFS